MINETRRINVNGILIEYEGEDAGIGYLFASKAAIQILIGPFSGHVIDRVGYDWPMMFGLTVMFFSTLMFAVGDTYSMLFIARALQVKKTCKILSSFRYQHQPFSFRALARPLQTLVVYQ